jgi:hypothetical protein
MSVNNGFKVGPLAERLSAGITGLLHFVTDTGQRRLTRANGSEWEDLVPDPEAIGALTEDAADALYAPIAHASSTSNPHSVTAAQAGAVSLTGDTMTGPLVVESGVTINRATALTNTNTVGLTISHTTSGTPALGFAVRAQMLLESTTEERQAFIQQADWTDATDATRTSRLRLYLARNGALAEAMRLDALDSTVITNLMVLYNGTLTRVAVGAADSGGTGYRALRIAN